MPLAPLIGHAGVRTALARAAGAGELPQSLLLHGAPGIGKQRLGLWIAQRLFCSQAGPADTEPCGECSGCRSTLRLEHPDLHWFFPLARPEGASPERLRDKLEESRGQELAARRADPFHLPVFKTAPAHFVAAVHSMQQLAIKPAAVARRKVLLVGDAEAMTPQESSTEAANAFLKLLEEPPANTYIVLTTAWPDALLPTIRSRLLPVRLLPLPGAEVAAFLRERRGIAAAEAERVAGIADGSIGMALRMLPGSGGSDAYGKGRAAGRELLERALDADAAAGFAAAIRAPSFGARGDALNALVSLQGWVRDLLAVLTGAESMVLDPAARRFLQDTIARRSPSAAGAARAIDRVDEAARLALGNVNPQLILADLLTRVRGDLRDAA